MALYARSPWARSEGTDAPEQFFYGAPDTNLTATGEEQGPWTVPGWTVAVG